MGTSVASLSVKAPDCSTIPPSTPSSAILNHACLRIRRRAQAVMFGLLTSPLLVPLTATAADVILAQSIVLVASPTLVSSLGCVPALGMHLHAGIFDCRIVLPPPKGETALRLRCYTQMHLRPMLSCTVLCWGTVRQEQTSLRRIRFPDLRIFSPELLALALALAHNLTLCFHRRRKCALFEEQTARGPPLRFEI
jgi:hypothetical protein